MCETVNFYSKPNLNDRLNIPLNVPVNIGQDISIYVLLLHSKAVVFEPGKDAFFIIVGTGFDELISLLSQHQNNLDVFADELRLKYKSLASCSGITLLMTERFECSGTELVSFHDRFLTFIDGSNRVHGKNISILLFILSVIGICWASLIVSLRKFHWIIGKGKLGNNGNVPSDKFINDVGYNFLLASRFMPISIDCKILAYVYKFIFGFYGYRCDIAIGILEEPFVAHMWATIGDTSLGEFPEVAEEFQLIYHSSWQN